VILIDDTYNASPASVAGALNLLKELKGRRIALLGEMAELGTRSAIEHQRIGTLSARSCDLLYLVGEQYQLIFEEAKKDGHMNVFWFGTKELALKKLLEELRAGDIVLLKGSRSQELESLIPELESKI
jgi:UDP-N-acetylmuramoyl-tripeptide--D-alanyl-D-alanine ligase